MGLAEKKRGAQIIRPSSMTMEESIEKAQERMSATDLEKLTPDRKAPFKIEVHFGSKRNRERAVGAIQGWESGKEFHGGGDRMMFICGYKDCGKYFPSTVVLGPVAICPHCKRQQYADKTDRKNEMLRGEPDCPVMVQMEIFSSDYSTIASMIEKRWLELSHREPPNGADIYLKYHPKDIKQAELTRLFHVNDVRRSRVPVIYPYANILKDTSAGQTLHSAILGLLKS